MWLCHADGRKQVSRVRTQQSIEVGQRYRDARITAFGARLRTIWVVDRVWQRSDGIEYVRLVQEDDRGRSKTIAASALSDRRNFIRVSA
jgi:hypothetical protein